MCLGKALVEMISLCFENNGNNEDTKQVRKAAEALWPLPGRSGSWEGAGEKAKVIKMEVKFELNLFAGQE